MRGTGRSRLLWIAPSHERKVRSETSKARAKSAPETPRRLRACRSSAAVIVTDFFGPPRPIGGPWAAFRRFEAALSSRRKAAQWASEGLMARISIVSTRRRKSRSESQVAHIFS